MAGIIRIALTGKLRAGKSVAATHLYLRHGFQVVSFGEKLKQAADDLLGDSDAYPTEYIERGAPCPLTGERTKVKRKPRRLYQDFGQAMRELDPDIWVRHAESMVDYYAQFRDTRGIVIDDLRQPNEEKWARENGFSIVRISANEDTRIARAKAAGDEFSEEDLRHPTEQYIDDFEADYEIWNDDDNRAELERKIDEIIRSLPSEK